MSEKRFAIIVLGSISCCMIVIAVFNFFINPTAEFPHEIFSPIIQLSRKEKVKLFDDYLTQNGPPSILLIGSSCSMMIKVKRVRSKIEKATRQNWPIFHFAVNSASVEDYYAILKFVLERHAVPKLVFIAQDFRIFNPHMPTDKRLFSTADLYRQLSGDGFRLPIPKRLSRLGNLFGISCTANSLTALYHAAIGTVPPEMYDSRGDSPIKAKSRKPLGAHRAKEMFYQHLEEGGDFYGYHALDEKRVQLLDKLYALAQENGIRIVTWLTTVHPLQFRQINHDETLHAVYDRIVEMEKTLAERHHHRFIDGLMDPTAVDCNGSDFHRDLTHYSEECGQKIFDKGAIHFAGLSHIRAGTRVAMDDFLV